MKPPKGAVVRKFEIAAIQKDIKYNRLLFRGEIIR